MLDFTNIELPLSQEIADILETLLYYSVLDWKDLPNELKKELNRLSAPECERQFLEARKRHGMGFGM